MRGPLATERAPKKKERERKEKRQRKEKRVKGREKRRPKIIDIEVVVGYTGA